MHLKNVQYCALVSNPRAGWPVRGHVRPSSLENRYIHVTAEIFHIYSELLRRKCTACAAVACWQARVTVSIKNKQAVRLADWLTGLIFANCVASC